MHVRLHVCGGYVSCMILCCALPTAALCTCLCYFSIAHLMKLEGALSFIRCLTEEPGILPKVTGPWVSPCIPHVLSTCILTNALTINFLLSLAPVLWDNYKGETLLVTRFFFHEPSKLSICSWRIHIL